MRYLLLVMAFIGLSNVYAQFDVNGYLARYSDDIELQTIRQQMEYLQESKLISPLIREVEVRSRISDFESGADDFRLRLSMLNPSERKANKTYFEVQKQVFESQNIVDFSTLLGTRYLTLIQLKLYFDLRALINDHSSQLETLIEAYAQTGSSTKNVVQWQRRIVLNDLKLKEIEGELRQLEYFIRSGFDFSGELSLENFQLISTAQVMNEIGRIDVDTMKNIFVQNEINKAKLSNSDWDVNKQESFSNLAFVQAEYQPQSGDDFSENMGLQFGLKLPIINPDRSDLHRRKLEVIEDQQQVQEVTNEINAWLFNYKNNIITAYQQFTQLDSTLGSLPTISKIPADDVDTAIEIDQFKYDLKYERLKVLQTFYNNYIRWMQTSGLLTQRPLTNHLSALKDPLDID